MSSHEGSTRAVVPPSPPSYTTSLEGRVQHIEGLAGIGVEHTAIKAHLLEGVLNVVGGAVPPEAERLTEINQLRRSALQGSCGTVPGWR